MILRKLLQKQNDLSKKWNTTTIINTMTNFRNNTIKTNNQHDSVTISIIV